MTECCNINWRMLTSALKTLVKYPKQVSFYEKLCNHYSIKSNILYFQDTISICKFINECPEDTSLQDPY